MTLAFRYIPALREDGTPYRAPLIPIQAIDQEGCPVEVIALIDSGADSVVVPKTLALALGLKESQEETLSQGIGGSTPIRESEFVFTLEGTHERYKIRTKVSVLQTTLQKVPVLLGRKGFFEHFHVTIKDDEGMVLLDNAPRPKV